MAQGEDLLTTPQVAHLLSKGARTIQRMAASGELMPVAKLPGPNGAYLFRRRDIEKLLARAPKAAS